MTDTSPHIPYIQKCLSLAEQSPPRPTNFRVGAILLSRKDNDPTFADDRILSTGYTMELAGNTHAEQCCFSNYAAVHKVSDDAVASVLPAESDRKLIMYVTMEPCGKRLSGNAPCAQRIARTTEGHNGIHKVYFGVKEPVTFVGESEGCRMLTEAGIEWEHVGGLEREILTIAFAGHENGAEEVEAALEKKEGTRDIRLSTSLPSVTILTSTLYPKKHTESKNEPMEADNNDSLVFYPAFCFKASPTHFTWVKIGAADVHRLRKYGSFVGQKVFFYNNHPVRFVSLLGLIVARTDVYGRTILALDDSSGAIVEVIVLHDPTTKPGVAAASAKEELDQRRIDIFTGEPIAADQTPWSAFSVTERDITHFQKTTHITATDRHVVDISSLQPGTLVRVKGVLGTFRGTMQVQLERFERVGDTNAEMKFLDDRLRFLVEVLSVPWVLDDDEVESLRQAAERGDEKVLEEKRRAERRAKKRAEREEKDTRAIARRYEREERAREKQLSALRENGEKVMKRFGFQDPGL
ncbi:unnamed protein product [Penicillium bialowiezense]